MKPRDLTIDHLSTQLGLTERNLWHLSNHSEYMFRPTRKQVARAGKEREIDPPKAWAKKILRKLHRFILREFLFPKSVHGGIRKRSCFTSATEHLGRTYVISRDISNAYPSIKTEPLRQALLRFGFRSDVARLLAGLLTVHGRIPQGAPPSSDALNFFLADADKAIMRKCAATKRARFTRIYDDFIISTNSKAAAETLGMTIEEQVAKLGLLINEKKKKKSGLQPRSRIQKVHNIAVNSPKGTKIVPDQKEQALEIAASYVHAARCVTADSFLSLVKRRERLHGWRHHTAQARIGPSKHLKRQLNTGDRLVRERLRRLGILPKNGRWWIRSKNTTPNQVVAVWVKRSLREAA